MEKNYRKNQVTSANHSKIARQQFKAETNQLAQNKSFIEKITSRKIAQNVAKTTESRLIKGRIDFAKGRMKSLNEMSSVLEEVLATQDVVSRRADRIIASYLAEKNQNAEILV